MSNNIHPFDTLFIQDPTPSMAVLDKAHFAVTTAAGGLIVYSIAVPLPPEYVAQGAHAFGIVEMRAIEATNDEEVALLKQRPLAYAKQEGLRLPAVDPAKVNDLMPMWAVLVDMMVAQAKAAPKPNPNLKGLN